MPHLIVEYAEELMPEEEIPAMLEAVHMAAVESSLFDSSRIKVRALPIAHYLVAGDGLPFVHAQLRIKDGRSDEQKKLLSELVLVALREQLPKAFVITVEVVEMDSASYAKFSY